MAKKCSSDPALRELERELQANTQALKDAYLRFDYVCDNDLVESCIFEINALKARSNYLLRQIKQRSGQPVPSGIPQAVAVPVQVIAVGPLAIFAMPGEMYVEFGKMCKKLRPYAMVASLANAAVGYVPIRELFQPGIYEARLCEGSQLPPDAGYRMVEALAEMAETLR